MITRRAPIRRQRSKPRPGRLRGKDLEKLRKDCFKRDRHTCTDCGERVFDGLWEGHPRKAHMAHVVGRGRGGTDVLSNVATKCGTCHMVKEHNPKPCPPKRSAA